jgi:hypothetical protein
MCALPGVGEAAQQRLAPCVVRFAARGCWPRHRVLARGKTKRSPHNVIDWPPSSVLCLGVPRRAPSYSVTGINRTTNT